TANLNKAVKLTPSAFPKISSSIPKKRNVWYSKLEYQKTRPYVFTEQGVAMLSSVLRSKGAVLVNIAIMRAFVRLRQLLATHADLARKLEELEKRFDAQFQVVFEAIRQLMAPPVAKPK